jgi:aryl-alcohol dehydrogenase-like predicted oxidoreductase
MLQRTIGGTGISVTAIGLGAMPLSIAGRPDERQAFAVIEAFLERGGNFIDTANVYCLDDGDIGHNERLIRRALQHFGRSAEVIVATKCGLRRPNGAWTVDGSPECIRSSCEQSLKALEVDRIPLYQLHAIDPRLGVKPTVEALAQLREEGKFLHLGLSNVNLDELQSALSIMPVVSVQNRCNPFEKEDLNNGLADFCRDRGITYIPHSPVGGHHGHTRLARQSTFLRLSGKYGVSPYCIVLAWFLSKGEHILPIPGASKVNSIVDSMKSLELRLEPADLHVIDRLPDDEEA